jgi:hypothetical protein
MLADAGNEDHPYLQRRKRTDEETRTERPSVGSERRTYSFLHKAAMECLLFIGADESVSFPN